MMLSSIIVAPLSANSYAAQVPLNTCVLGSARDNLSMIAHSSGALLIVRSSIFSHG
jgi:hypothetical protein